MYLQDVFLSTQHILSYFILFLLPRCFYLDTAGWKSLAISSGQYYIPFFLFLPHLLCIACFLSGICLFPALPDVGLPDFWSILAPWKPFSVFHSRDPSITCLTCKPHFPLLTVTAELGFMQTNAFCVAQVWTQPVLYTQWHQVHSWEKYLGMTCGNVPTVPIKLRFQSLCSGSNGQAGRQYCILDFLLCAGC